MLRRGSQISTSAGTASAGGDGGNININTPFIVAALKEGSNITANAYTGKGGNVNLTVQSLFGIEPRAFVTSESGITASSRFGTQGQININQPEIQPTQEFQQLSEQFADASNQIGQTCSRGAFNAKPLGEFTVTGRGSFPPNPLESLPGTATTNKLIETDTSLSSISSIKNPSLPTPTQFVEAQAWVKGADGNITLVAMAPNLATPKAGSIINTCHNEESL